MPLPAGLNIKGLQPEVKIYDNNNVLKYTWQHEDIVSSAPTTDFDLFGYDLHLGHGSDLGRIQLDIHDYQKALVDLTDPTIPSKILNEWRIKFSLGKDPTGLKTVFDAKLRIPETGRLPKYQSMHLFGVGRATVLADWYLAIKYIQKKTGDGITPDSTDTTAKVSELAKSFYTKIENYPLSNIGTPPFTVNGISDIDIKLADYIKSYQPIVSSMNELCNSSNSDWGIDYEPSTPDVWMFPKASKSSGLLFTNDLNSLKTQNWNVGKIGFLLTHPRRHGDSTVDRGFSIYFGLGVYNPELDWDKTTQNAASAMHEDNFFFAVTPKKPTIVELRIAVARVGTPAQDMLIHLIAQDGSGAPNQSAKFSSTVIKKETLQALSTSEQYMHVSFELNPADVVPNTKMFVMIEKNGDSSNYLAVYRQSGVGEYWKGGSQFVGEHKISTYHAQETIVHFVDYNALKDYGPRQLPVQLPRVNVNTALVILSAYAQKMKRRKRTYDPIRVSAPYVPVKPGFTAQIYDKFNGLNTTVKITSLNISANAYQIRSGGVNQMMLNIDEVLI